MPGPGGHNPVTSADAGAALLFWEAERSPSVEYGAVAIAVKHALAPINQVSGRGAVYEFCFCPTGLLCHTN